MLRRLFDIEAWGLKEFVYFIVALFSLSMLGPNGFLKFLFLKQKIADLSTQSQILSQQKESLEREIKKINRSQNYQMTLIREHLGYLQENEVSINFIPGEFKNDRKKTTR